MRKVCAAVALGAAATLGVARQSFAGDVSLAPCDGAPNCDDGTRILDAMREVASTGGTLYLTDGNPATVDVYEVDHCLDPWAEDDSFTFQGTIQGESMGNTIAEAVRHPDGSGFEPCSFFGNGNYVGILLWLFEPAGDITLADMTFQVRDPQPCDSYPDQFWGETTAMNNLVVIAGTDAAVTVRNVAFSGNHDDPKGHTGQAGKNLGFGFIRNAGPPFIAAGQGPLTITGSKFDNARVCVEIDSLVTTDVVVDDSTFSNCSRSGLDLLFLGANPVDISNSRFRKNDNANMRLGGENSNVTCTDNRVDTTFVADGCPIE